MSRLRQALGRDAVIELALTGYRLAADPGDVDAHRFKRLSDEGRLALGGGDPGRASVLLREALGLWRGPALADAAEAGSVQARIMELEERRLGALEDRIEADLRRGEHQAAVPELRELVGRHPLRERPRGLLMRALYAGGRQAEALVTFEEVRRLLAEELGAEDLAEVAALLGTARLVTLLGPGGAGKTRLSIEAAGRLPDVCFVELAPLRDGRRLPQTLLSALGLREGGLLTAPAETTPVSRLIAALAERPPPLLVLAPGKVVGMYSARRNTKAKAMFYFGSPPLSYDRHDDDQQRRILAKAFAGIGWETPRLLEAMWEAPDFYFDSISQVHMESWSRGRAVLLGDAACCASPLSGMGTGLAMVGAYVLAGELAAAGGDHRVGFARYEEAMRGYAAGCQKSGEGVGRWMVPENRFIAWFMNQNYRLLPYVPWKGLIAKSVRKAASAITLKDYGHRSAVPSRNRR